jgi:hypothetical protein
MEWQVIFHDDFSSEFASFDLEVKEGILSSVKYLKINGFNLGRPQVDTLKSSEIKNLKELRITVKRVNGAWHSPLITKEKPFFWWVQTKRALAKNYFIIALFRLLRNALSNI